MSDKYFRVTVREVYYQDYFVKASNEQEARKKAVNCEGALIDCTAEYSHTLGESYATAEEVSSVPEEYIGVLEQET